ncbi:MAG: helix-turn-helix transcriptional regulator [Rhodospirillales bacterium]|nr:helix-turn-helix transcriptional regulator [Rhodospirillales bacterium]
MGYEKAIDRFFGAALHPEDWPAALEDIAQSLGADAATLVVGSSTRPTVAESPLIKPIVAEYFLRGAPLDPREARVRPGLGEGFVDDFAHFTQEEIDHDPFYQEFLRPVGFGWHAVACLGGEASKIVLSLKRRASRGAFEPHEIEAMDKVLPHLRGAASAARQAWGMALDDQLATTARFGHGGILLNQRGRAVRVGPGVPLGDGLALVSGSPRAAYQNDQAQLDLAIAIATATAAPSDLPPPPAVALHRPSGKRPLVVRALPLDGAKRSLLAPAVAMMMVTDLAEVRQPPADVLRTVFGLTPKETELAIRLAAGDTVEQAAEALEISPAHARQRLKVLFDKTDTRRQSELVMILSRLA